MGGSKSLLLGAVAALAMLPAGAGYAADEPQTTDDSGALETVVVRARRVSEDAQKVPISMTSFDDAALDRDRVETLYDLMDFVPSANVSGYQNRDQQWISLRGQGQTGFDVGGGVGGGPAVVGYFSEVPVPIAGAGLYYDLASVQVLEGPQGTLFGRNTTGGAVLFEPARPDYQFGGYGQLNFGSYGRAEAQGEVNLPLVDGKLALRLAGQAGHTDGFTKDVVTGTDYDNQNYQALRASLLFQPTSDIENYFIANWTAYKNNGPGNILIAVDPAIAPSLVPYLQAQQAMGVRKADLDMGGVGELSEGQFLTLLDKTSYNFSDSLTARNIFSYSTDQTRKQENENGAPVPVIWSLGSSPGDWNVDRRTFTEEFRFEGKLGGDLINWQSGVYAESMDTPQRTTFTQQFGSFFVHSNAAETSTSEAVYAHADVNLDAILSGLRGTVGGRYTWDHLTYDLGVTGGGTLYPSGGDFCLINTPTSACRAHASSNNSGDSLEVGLNYQITPATLLYVDLRQGYKRGGFNMIAAELGDSSAFAYKPEYVDDVELGVKSEWSLFGMPAKTNVSLYDSRYRDGQTLSSANVDGTVQGITVNAARATIRGAELQAKLVPSKRLELNLTYSYLDAFYNNYITPVGQDFTHTPYPYAPRNKVASGARYRLTPIGSETVWLGANYTYQSSTYVGITENAGGVSPANRVAGYGLLSLRLDWEDLLGSGATASLWATNVTNEIYKTTVEDLYAATGASIASYGAPRMVGVTLRASF